MPQWKFTGFVTKDYELNLRPKNGVYHCDDFEYYFMQDIEKTEKPSESESFFLNNLYIKNSDLFANATVKHLFSEVAQGLDLDEAEESLLRGGDCVYNINKDHEGKYLIEINDIERID